MTTETANLTPAMESGLDSSTTGGPAVRAESAGPTESGRHDSNVRPLGPKPRSTLTRNSQPASEVTTQSLVSPTRDDAPTRDQRALGSDARANKSGTSDSGNPPNRTCVFCKQRFHSSHPTPSAKNPGKFCSRRCFGAMARGEPPVSNAAQWFSNHAHVAVADALQYVADGGDAVYRYSFRKPRRGYLYFLTKGERIVYIGATIRLESRMTRHRRLLKGQFDNAFYVTVPIDLLSVVEADVIGKIRPPLNVKMARAGAWQPRQPAPQKRAPAPRIDWPPTVPDDFPLTVSTKGYYVRFAGRPRWVCGKLSPANALAIYARKSGQLFAGGAR